MNRHALEVTSPTVGAHMYVCIYIHTMIPLHTYMCGGRATHTRTRFVLFSWQQLRALGTTALLSLSPSELCCC